ncbi:hypothetical protein T484DRAFT_1849471, partial [Baffinella frigidus]
MADATTIRTVQECIHAGNTALVAQEFEKAAQVYTHALDRGDAGDLEPVLLSNRSSAFAHLEMWTEALIDAERCVVLKPQWSRSHAWVGRKQEAMAAFRYALSVDPDNEELQLIVLEIE